MLGGEEDDNKVMSSAEELKIDCTGYSVAADWYAGKHTDAILLSLIGWDSDRKRYGDILSAIVASTGMSALVFDYSGHGDSPFSMQETRPAQHFLEVICVYDWLAAQYPSAKITVMGTSYGGYLATQLTKYRAFDRLVLRAPAIYRPEDFYNLAPDIHDSAGTAAFRNDSESIAKHPLLARASSFKGQALVVVHEKDEQIPTAITDAYIRTFNADVHIAKGFPHSIGDMPRDQIESYQRTISDWLLAKH